MSRPEITFKAGAVRASVFVNMIQRNGQSIPLRKVVLEVRYRDKDGQWKGSHSLSLNELPKAMTVLQKAYEYLLSDDVKAMDQAEGEKPQPSPPDTGPQPNNAVPPAYQQASLAQQPGNAPDRNQIPRQIGSMYV